MTEVNISESLKKTAKGTAIAFLGMIIFMFLEFITRVIIARNTTQTDYGIFNIGFVLLNFFVILACLGLNAGSPRYIAYLKGKDETNKIAGVVLSSLQLSFIAGIFIFLFFFFFSDLFTDIFHLQKSSVLKIFAIAVPFSVMVEMLASLFTGFGRVEEKVYFRDILASVLKVVFIVSVIYLGYTFLEMMYAYLLSIVISAAVFIIYAVKKLGIVRSKDTYTVRKEIILFSLPLLATNILNIVIVQIDTLLIGYFKTTEMVGLYNAAHPIVQFLNIFLISLSFIYVPIASHLYSKNLVDEMRRNYIILTKWVFSVTFPVFLIMFLFPEAVLKILFGASYAQESVVLALRILSLGMFINVAFGPNAVTLIVIGKTKLILIDNLIGAIINVSLNLLLIPTMGIVGAAIASTVTLGTVNILKSAQIFHFHRIHPFAKNYLKPVVLSSVFVYFIHELIKIFWGTQLNIWMLIALCILFLGVFIISMLITNSLDKEDIYLTKAILNKFIPIS